MPWAGRPAHAPDTCRESPGVSRFCALVATDLFLAASAWPSESLARVVPPSCGRGIDPAPSPEPDRDAHARRLYAAVTDAARVAASSGHRESER